MDFFVTYGDKKYQNSKIRLINQAREFGFKNVRAYSPIDLSKSFIEATKPYIYMKRGAEYWIWKAFLLKDSFSKMKEDEVLVYLDAGCEINLNGRNRFNEYMDILDENNGVLSFHLPNCYEYNYTNQNVMNFFRIKLNSEIYNSEQLVGGVLMFKKNSYTTQLINEYYQLAIMHSKLFSDENSFSNDSKFVEHRHDQSIFSLLRKVKGLKSIPNETWSNNWSEIEFSPFHAKKIEDPIIHPLIVFYRFLKRFVTRIS